MQPPAAFDSDLSPATGLHGMIGMVAEELTDLRHRVDDLQDLIGVLAEAAGPGLTKDVIVRLQDVDSVSQRLTRLAQLARVLQGVTPEDLPPLSAGEDLFDALVRLRGARGKPAV